MASLHAGPQTSVDGNAESGQFAANIGAVGSDATLSQAIQTTAGQHYTLTFWLANAGGGPNDFTVKWNGTTLLSLVNAPAQGYTQYTFDVVGTAGTSQLLIGGRQDPSHWNLDAISVTASGCRGHRHVAPTGGTPDLVAASDSGVSATDNITAVTSPTFTVALDPTVAAGDTVQLLLGGSALAHNVTHTITSADITAGSVSLTVTAGDLGADGSKSISAKFTDAAGNSSTTAALAVTLDTTVPTGGTPDLVAASDSGVSTTDNITAVTSPTFTVALNPTVAAGDTVQLLLGGSALAHNVTHTITSADITAGSVSLTVTAGDLGADGSKSISAKFTDAAGNSSTTSALAVTLNTTAPTGGTPDLVAASDTGVSHRQRSPAAAPAKDFTVALIRRSSRRHGPTAARRSLAHLRGTTPADVPRQSRPAA